MASIFEALKSIGSTGMPEGQNPPDRSVSQTIREITHGGVIEPSSGQPKPGIIEHLKTGAAESANVPGLFTQGFREAIHHTQAQLGAQTGGEIANAVTGGTPEPGYLEAQAAAAAKRQEILNQAGTLAKTAAVGILGLAGRAGKGILGAGARALTGKRHSQPRIIIENNSPQLVAGNSDDNSEKVVEGEFREA